jgi:hypothetical protein
VDVCNEKYDAFIERKRLQAVKAPANLNINMSCILKQRNQLK